MTTEGAALRQRLGWLVVAFAALAFIASSWGNGDTKESVAASPTAHSLGTSKMVGVFEGLWESALGLLTVRADGSFVLSQGDAADRNGRFDHYVGNNATGTITAEGVQIAFVYSREEDVVVVSDIGGAHATSFCGPNAAPVRCGE